MSEYFKPWRRKLGVLTLVFACVFAGWWVKSMFTPPLPYRLQIEFVRNGLRVGIQEANLSVMVVGTVTMITSTGTWFDRFGLTIPYWSITIPLTLLSAWLLLSKTRKRAANSIG